MSKLWKNLKSHLLRHSILCDKSFTTALTTDSINFFNNLTTGSMNFGTNLSTGYLNFGTLTSQTFLNGTVSVKKLISPAINDTIDLFNTILLLLGL